MILFTSVKVPDAAVSVDVDNSSDTLCYLFAGHTYHGLRVDPRLISLDKTKYSRIWLGGDICSEALLEKSTVQHIDNVFDLAKPTTQYALGNHDVRNGNMQWYKSFCERESFNYYSANGAVSVCLNSMLNPTLCEELNSQYRMLKTICDTISESKHLFVFHHAGLWDRVPDLPPSATYSHSNFIYWSANCDSATSYYENTIYPMLKEVRSRGIKVYCIIGDTGTGSLKGFHQETSDSIHFFASGLYNAKYLHNPILFQAQIPDSILVFKHDLINQQMEWQFHGLDSLLNEQ